MEPKDILNLGISSATAMLSVVLALLAILPIVFDLVSDRVKAYFEAGNVRSRVNFIFGLLIAVAAILTISLVFSFVAVLLPCLITAAAHTGIIALIASMLGLVWVIALAGLVLRSISSKTR